METVDTGLGGPNFENEVYSCGRHQRKGEAYRSIFLDKVTEKFDFLMLAFS